MNKRFFTFIFCIVCILIASTTPTIAADKGKGDVTKCDEKCYNRFNEVRTVNMYSPKALVLADSIYTLGVDRKDYRYKILADILRFPVYFGQQKLDSMQTAFDELKQLSRDNEVYYYYYFACDGECMMYSILSQHAKAMMCAREMLSTAIKDKNPDYLSMAYKDMGVIYSQRCNNILAMQYLKKAIENMPKSEDPLANQYNLTYLECLIDCQKYDVVRQLLEKTIARCKGENEIYLPNCLVIGAWLGFYTTDKPLFEKYYNVINTAKYDQYIQPDVKECIQAIWLLWNGKESEAMPLLNKQPRKTQLNILSTFYQIKGDYKMALQTEKRKAEYNDSLQAAIATEDLTLSDSQLNNAILKEQAEKQKLKTQVTMAISISVILLMLLIFAAYTTSRHKKHAAELNLKNKELQKAEEKERKASEIKSIFIKNMTHELHTPMNHIMGFAQLLADDDTPLDETSTKEMSKALYEGAQQLNGILDNIIEVSNRLEGAESLSDVKSVLEQGSSSSVK